MYFDSALKVLIFEMEKRGLFILLSCVLLSACSSKVFKEHLSNHINHALPSIELAEEPENTGFNFLAAALEDFVEFTWETNSEEGILSFEVEKAIDTLEFKAIVGIEPFSSETGSSYLEADNKLIFNKLIRYRLKINKKDTTLFTDPIELIIEKPVDKVELIRNPSNQIDFLQFLSQTQSEGTILIYDSNGLTNQDSIHIQNGINEIELGVFEKPSGVYFVQFNAPRTTWNGRILKIGT